MWKKTKKNLKKIHSRLFTVRPASIVRPNLNWYSSHCYGSVVFFLVRSFFVSLNKNIMMRMRGRKKKLEAGRRRVTYIPFCIQTKKKRSPRSISFVVSFFCSFKNTGIILVFAETGYAVFQRTIEELNCWGTLTL